MVFPRNFLAFDCTKCLLEAGTEAEPLLPPPTTQNPPPPTFYTEQGSPPFLSYQHSNLGRISQHFDNTPISMHIPLKY